jgi:general secretion pathway protein A
MYDNFCQLKQDPFAETPDPEFLFLSPSHKAALHALISGIEARQELLAIFGAPGLGKTTILHACQARIQPLFRTLFIGYPKLSFRDVLALICKEYGLSCAVDNPTATFLHLYQTLREEPNNDCPVVLLIDEAHQIPVQTLESFLQLFAFQTCMEEKLFQIVLAGLPELQRTLNLPQLRALKERLTVHVTLSPLTPDESLAYICHRLTKVLMPEDELFTPGALKRIIHSAHGNPRILNTLCSNMLITSSLRQQKPISVQIAREVIADMKTQNSHAYVRWGGVVAAVLLLVAGLWWRAQSQWLDAPKRGTLELSHLTQRMADLVRGSTAEQPLEEAALPTQDGFVAPPPQTVPEQKPPSMDSPVPVPPSLQTGESALPQVPAPVEPKDRRSPRVSEQEVTKAPVVQPKSKPVAPSTGSSEGRDKAPMEVAALTHSTPVPPLPQAATRQERPPAAASSAPLARKLKAIDRVLLREPETAVPMERPSADTQRREAAELATNVPTVSSRLESTSPGAVMNEGPGSSPAATSREYIGATPGTDREAAQARTSRAAFTSKGQTVHFHSFPEAAIVLIDGKSVGRTPITVQLPLGYHSILIEKSGHTSVSYELRIDRDGESNLYHNLRADISGR